MDASCLKQPLEELFVTHMNPVWQNPQLFFFFTRLLKWNKKTPLWTTFELHKPVEKHCIYKMNACMHKYYLLFKTLGWVRMFYPARSLIYLNRNTVKLPTLLIQSFKFPFSILKYKWLQCHVSLQKSSWYADLCTHFLCSVNVLIETNCWCSINKMFWRTAFICCIYC